MRESGDVDWTEYCIVGSAQWSDACLLPVPHNHGLPGVSTGKGNACIQIYFMSHLCCLGMAGRFKLFSHNSANMKVLGISVYFLKGFENSICLSCMSKFVFQALLQLHV